MFGFSHRGFSWLSLFPIRQDWQIICNWLVTIASDLLEIKFKVQKGVCRLPFATCSCGYWKHPQSNSIEVGSRLKRVFLSRRFRFAVCIWMHMFAKADFSMQMLEKPGSDHGTFFSGRSALYHVLARSWAPFVRVVILNASKIFDQCFREPQCFNWNFQWVRQTNITTGSRIMFTPITPSRRRSTTR